MQSSEIITIPESIPARGGRSTEEDAFPSQQLKCGVWYKATTSRCGTIKDCDNVTYEEFKRVAARVADAINSGVQSVCDGLGCPNKQFRNDEWSQDCSNRRLCVTCEVEFRCLA